MKKILIVFGTRPEAIKMIPVFLELKKYFHVKICVTGQHREMLDQVLDIFEITPDFDLNIMKNKQDLFDINTKVLIGMKKILFKVKPDLLLVHGDTTTTMASSMAAFYCKIKIGHVEAGLRTNDIFSPFPEELNRQITDRVSTFHFAPTENARQNLLKEKINSEGIYVTGNTVIDSLFSIVKKARSVAFSKNLLSQLPFLKNKHEDCILLVTGHRRDNFGKGINEICKAVLDLSNMHSQLQIVLPVHYNPEVRKPIIQLLSNIKNVHIIAPLEYVQFIKLMDLSYIILTDSGGIQEEAPSLGKPVLVMRNKTERPEGVAAGAVKVVGSNSKVIVKAVNSLLNNQKLYTKMSQAKNPYGDGNASERIRKFLLENFK